MTLGRLISLSFIALAACGTSGPTHAPHLDGGTGDADASTCTALDRCDDGIYCNGVEHCELPGPPARIGLCIAGESPCIENQICDEETDHCVTICDETQDADLDGHDAVECGGDDCDDTDPDRYPGNPERCDGKDDDCNGMEDDGLELIDFYPDCDGDGFGSDESSAVTACAQPMASPMCVWGAAPSWSNNHLDCIDTDDTINPARMEIMCNAIDDDCDGQLSIEEDMDRDGFSSMDCGGTDCDDSNPIVYPGAPEICDRLDNDCSGTGGIDVSEDADEDGHAPMTSSCSGGPLPADDCDDRQRSVHPGLPEVCDGLDNDCNGAVDEAPFAAESCRTLPETTMACSDGSCTVASCPVGKNDCDGAYANGCESDPSIDGFNCGGCGMRCDLECVDGVCDPPVQLALGESHSCARLASGHVVCWGLNDFGSLGDGTRRVHNRPVEVVGIDDAVELEAGDGHTCARRASGRVVCWGRNDHGQLGDGTTTTQVTPTAVVGLSGVIEISLGSRHTCARLADGTAKCWGDNYSGQLGDGTTRERHTPVAVMGLTDAEEVEAGGYWTCARHTSGDVSCWGSNSRGQLGDNTTTSSPTGVRVMALPDAAELSAGGGFNCARRSSGQVVCWGRNRSGQLGNSSTWDAPTPVYAWGVSDAVQIATGSRHSCARRLSVTVSCWGENGGGQLGDGGTRDRDSAVEVLGLPDAVEIVAGGAHTCARRASGEVLCWGRNGWGELGDGTFVSRSSPVRVWPL
ncbi:MAG: hypothetical protein GXP55_04695 [Deltaproteobacteria bacterium]|nr:hypothetical protein [Deltaproteobacteria bacterium]